MRKRIFFTIVLSLCAVEFGAFAATKQKSTSAGTKIATASENTMIPSACQDAFYGCMDAFCMLDNAAGGRCQCSDRITELDKALEDIVKLDEQTYLMATEGVELIQMGEAEDQVIARAKAAANKISVEDSNTNKTKKKTTRSLDLSAWNTVAFIDQDDDMFDDYESDTVSSLSGKQGDDLFSTSAKMCSSQLADNCRTYRSMLQMAYSQKVKSDCVAYENSLKIQKNQSQQKLQTAQKALRDAALDEYQNKNKYATVGECAVAFATCMQTTAGCGKDYTGCVTLAAQENVRNNKGGVKAKQTKIKGAVSGADVTLAAATMNQLLAKKPMCETVTKQCVNSNKNDAVWDTFLRNAAPALKSAELVAEQKLRSDCIPTAAECFKNACLSKFGEDDEGYDMCLSNPETYKSLCKVQLEPCLEATGGTYDNPTASSLWNGLVALLNSMKVDACTAQITKCLTDRCGSDYSECIGLDTESIGNLCPVEKLTACVSDGKYADGNGGENTIAIREYVAEIAQGLALKIDNALLTACRNAVNDSIIRACGDNESCDAMIDNTLGTTGLDYKVCQIITNQNNNNITINQAACKESSAQITKEEFGLDTLTTENRRQIGSYVFDVGLRGLVSQSRTSYMNVSRYVVRPGETSMYTPVISGYVNWDASFRTDYEENGNSTNIKFVCEENAQCDSVILNSMNNTAQRIISSIESDPRVQYCMTGRRVQGFNGLTNVDSSNTARYPNLTRQTRQDIIDLVYSKTVSNYNAKLSELESKRDEDYLAIASKYEEVLDENKQVAEAQRNATTCASLNRNSNEWNYKEAITATYSESAKTCTKKITITKCESTSYASDPGRRTCVKWGTPTTTTEVINM
jgi:hypothetical protein